MESITSELVTTIIDHQNNSDQLLLELEKKQLKFEEKQAERKAEQQCEERMFQLQMLQMMSWFILWATNITWPRCTTLYFWFRAFK